MSSDDYKAGLTYAIEEIRGWRVLTIKVFKDCPTENPKEALRECRNKLSLLGVIEVNLRQKRGDPAKDIWADDRARHEHEREWV